MPSRWRPSMTAEVLAPAKINLTLHVTGQRGDGYHLLDSLVAFADFGDTLRADPAPSLSLTVTGPHAADLDAGEGNLVLRAARLFAEPRGAALHLTKRLPVAAGLGGGSSDAAAALRALSRLWNRPLPSAEAALRLGADVPVCLHGRAVRMGGVGNRLDRVPPLPPMDLLLVNPGRPVSTADVFRRLERRDNPAMGRVPAFPDTPAFCLWLSHQRNDLLAPALDLCPEIDDILDAIRGTGALFTGMSGSGPTCFGLYPPGGAPNTGALRHQGWWAAAGRIS